MRQPLFALMLMAAAPASAQDAILYPYDGSYVDATFAVENAIVNRGLVVDWISYVGKMLNRTGEDVGSSVKIFENAEIYMFCSAQVSREVMEVDPMNIVHCPYSIFVAETVDGVVIGHRRYPDGEMQKVQALVSEIATEAAAN